MVKIMIADDQQLIRESLKIILDSDPSFEVVKVVGSGQEVLDSLKTESVDIILMDVRMPNMSGVDCTRIVKKEYPNIKVIILTTFDDDEYIYDALKYGASGYLLKGCSLEELSSAIHSVLSGGACFILIREQMWQEKLHSSFRKWQTRIRNLVLSMKKILT